MDIQKKIALNVSMKLSEKICQKIANQTKIRLQKIDSKIEEVKSLKNVWDDVCYQHQKEMSNAWKHYDQAVVSIVRSLVKDLENYELNAVLLQIPDAQRHVLDTIKNKLVPSDNRQTIDFSENEFYVSRYIMRKYIYEKADTWSNNSLRKAVRVSQH